MTPLNGRLKGFPRNMDLDEKTMLSIARMIAYVMVGSTHHQNAPHELTKQMIELDAKIVDKWLTEGSKHVCKKSKS